MASGSFKRAPVTGGAAPRHNVLDSLRATQIVGSKPVLPAELIAQILDYLSIPDLLRFARTSRRMCEMVYDDTRWVSRLKAMGLWNDVEARRRAEEVRRRQMEIQKAREPEEEARRLGIVQGQSEAGVLGVGNAQRAGTTLFDAGWEEDRRRQSLEKAKAAQPPLETGFDAMTLSHVAAPNSATPRDPALALKAMMQVRSIRGYARQEYGKVYGAMAPFYFDLARAQSHTDPILFRTYREPEQQASMLASLKVFARSDIAMGWESREEKLESMMGIFENAALREFEQGYGAGDVDGRMRRYAHVLVVLNGGAAAVDAFIQSHALFSESGGLGMLLDCIQSVSPGHGGAGVRLEPAHDYFRRLASSLNEQGAVIDRVFPPSVNVLTPFIERVAEDIISEYITTLFDEAHERSLEAYLKVVPGVFEAAAKFSRSIQPSKASPPDFSNQVAHLVASKAFEQHIDLYLQEELDFFKRASDGEVTAWEKRLDDEQQSTESFLMSNVSRQAAKRDFLTSFRKVVMMPVSVLPTPFAGSAKPASSPNPNLATTSGGEVLSAPSSRPSTPALPERSSSPNPPVSELPTTELAAKAAIMASRLEGIRSLFSIEVALNIIHAAKSSLDRAALFVKFPITQAAGEAREQCEIIFVELLNQLGGRHIRPGFDKAVEHLSHYNPRKLKEHGGNQGQVAPLVTFLELVNVGDLIQQMVDVFYVQEMVAPKLVDRDDFLAAANKEKKRFEQMLDERVAAGLNKGIDVLMEEVEFIAATTQSATDFNPGAAGAVDVKSDAVVDVGPTETATRIVELVSSHTGMLVGSTDKNMLDVFNQEVGLRLFTALCKHLKRQRISVEGAIKLISDTNAYYSYIATLRNKSLTQYFAALRELSQIYLISSKHAKEIATIIADQDRYYGIFRAEEVYEFAERRADWYLVKRDVERAMYGIGCGVM
ncbi:exocyst complex component Sec10-domain-containing protein [Lineolata rhizophorae]|uniref:Exocyst complex component Sec10-domain-containing protein n=1 Tax=Lineolata rhizophorae TaxID=578093 RepID=A0A6A6NTY4_9PEZI|nr:exocyst complex component Sec10-domain-containing protein [Lineolata rhizophorae]